MVQVFLLEVTWCDDRGAGYKQFLELWIGERQMKDSS